MSEKITKESIIKSLLDTAFYKSAGGTSLSDIAESLGIKKASLYNHFESRSDIIEQTTSSCAEYLKSISFIPAEIENVAKKYPVETVLKGIVSRYVKMHEKAPLFQIYTFVESQKYFDIKTARQVLSIISSTVRNCAEIPGDVAIPKTAEFKIITKIIKYSKNESASPST